MSKNLQPPVLKDFPNTHFYPEARLIMWHPRGVLDDALADKIVQFIETEEHRDSAPFHRYTDFSGLTQIRLQFGHTFRISEQRRAGHTGEQVKSAFYCNWIIGHGMAHLYEVLMEGSPIRVRAFRSREAAAAWLDVPAVILLPDDSGEEIHAG